LLNRLKFKIAGYTFIFATLVAVLVFLFLGYLLPNKELQKINSKIEEKIVCDNNFCDTDKFWNDWDFMKELSEFKYYIITSDGFLITSERIKSENFPLDTVNLEKNFQYSEIESLITPIEDKWRLFSKSFEEKKIKILVGWLEKSNVLLAETPSNKFIDSALKKAADKISERVILKKGRHEIENIESKVDGFLITNNEGRILNYEGSLPVYLSDFSKNINLIKNKKFYLDSEKEIYFISTKLAKNYWIVIAKDIGKIYTLFIFLFFWEIIIVLLSCFFIPNLIIRRKSYFDFDIAKKKGENQNIEFKEGVQFEEFLRNIVAFSNGGLSGSRGGMIFIGVSDNGEIVGINFHSKKEKARFNQKLRDLIKKHINPPVSVNIEFRNESGKEIIQIYVSPGIEREYTLDGKTWIRLNDSVEIANSEERKVIRDRFEKGESIK